MLASADIRKHNILNNFGRRVAKDLKNKNHQIADSRLETPKYVSTLRIRRSQVSTLSPLSTVSQSLVHPIKS